MGRRLSDYLALVHQGRWKAVGSERCCSGQLSTRAGGKISRNTGKARQGRSLWQSWTGRLLKEVGGFEGQTQDQASEMMVRTRLPWKCRWNCPEGVQAAKTLEVTG